MKNFFSLFFFLLIAQNSFGQDFEWAKRVGGAGADEGNSIATDILGNVYVVGSFIGTVDFDPGIGVFNLTSAGNYDVFVIKIDPSGVLIWAKRFGGTQNDDGVGVSLDPMGNILFTGFITGTADFDPSAGTFNLTSAGGTDVFVCSLNSSGDLNWANKFGSVANDEAASVVTDISGNVYTIGHFQNVVDFDPGVAVYNLNSAGGYDVFVLKLDNLGEFVWAKRIGGSGQDFGRSITTDLFGDVCLVGDFSSTVDFDPGVGVSNMTSGGSFDAFVSKLDNSGNLIWAKQFSGLSASYGSAVETDLFGNIYTTGSFTGNVDMDPGLGNYNFSSFGGTDLYVSKLSSSGNFVWAKQFGGLGYEYASSIGVSSLGEVYSTGYFYENGDFDPGPGVYILPSSSAKEVYISKIDSSGDFIWAKHLGGSNDDLANDIEVDANDNIYTTGQFSGTGDFDENISVFNLTASAADFFLHKQSYQTSFANISQSSCFSYAVPSGDEVYFVDGVYQDTIQSVFDCDSVITIDLTILNGTSSSFSVSECTFYTVPSGDETYYLDGIYSDTITNSDGCDSVMTITVNIIPPSTNSFTVFTCIPYTVPSGDETYSSPGIYYDTIPNSTGCDSVLTITIAPSITYNTIFISECTVYNSPSGDETYTFSGVYNDTIPNTAGCDSIITIDLIIIPPTYNSISITTCGPYTVPSGHEVYMYDGVYFDTIPNSGGCDSILTITLDILNPPVFINAQSCSSYTVPSGDETYTASGTYMDTLISFIGCDSMLIIDLEIVDSPNANFNTDSVDFCGSGSVTFFNLTTPPPASCLWQFGDGGTATSCGIVSHNYTTGVYDVTLTVTNNEGCTDSMTCDDCVIVSPNLVIVDPLDDEVCDSLVYIVPPFDTGGAGEYFFWSADLIGGGVIASGTGNSASFPISLGSVTDEVIVFCLVATSSQACTDTNCFQILVHPEPAISFTSNQITGCLPFTADFQNLSVPSGDNCIWNFGDGTSGTGCGSVSHSYLNVGSYDVDLVVTTTDGCSDSVTYNNYITVTSGAPSSSSISISSCEYYISPSSNYMWTSTGVYSDTIPNSAGCDSIITINLTINNPTASAQNISACDFLVSPSTNYTWTTSGTYADTLTNFAGCDSVITINLTINNSTASAQTIVSCDFMVSPSGNYTWISSGVYNDTIPNSAGCDSIITFNLTINTVNNAATQSGITLSATATGAAYQWLDCLNGYSIITGEINQEFTPIVSGEYAVVISANGCADTSICFVINEVGLESISEDMIRIFPNPGNGKFTVLLNADYSENVVFELSNSLGQVVYSGVFNDIENQLELILAEGIYFLNITSGSSSQVFDVIIQD